VPSRKIALGRGTASPLHAPQDPPSPGAARRPLPARERRLFLVSLGRGGSVPSTHSTERTLPAGNVGATRWVARRGRGGWAPGMMPCRRARSHQGDAPRRPYMHRVQPRALYQSTSQRAGVHVVGAVREPPLQRLPCCGGGLGPRASRPHPHPPCGARTAVYVLTFMLRFADVARLPWMPTQLLRCRCRLRAAAN